MAHQETAHIELCELDNQKRVVEYNDSSRGEKTQLIDEKDGIDFRFWAIAVSWISVVVSAILGITALAVAAVLNSQALFSFGLDSVLDGVSSSIVLWRFYGGEKSYSETRELRACIFIGGLFLVAACILAAKCILAFVSDETPEKPSIVLILSGIDAGLCLALGFTKVWLGIKLRCRSLFTDSIITLVGAVMSIFTLLFSGIYERNKHLWYIDPIFGLTASAFLAIYGISVLVISVRELKYERFFETEKRSLGQ